MFSFLEGPVLRLNAHYRLKNDISIFEDSMSGPTISDNDLLGPLTEMLMFLCVKLATQFASGWDYKVSDNKNSVSLFKLQVLPKVGAVVKHSIVVDYRKKVSVTVSGKIMSLTSFDWIESSTLKTWGDLRRIMEHLNEENEMESSADETIHQCIESLKSIEFDDSKKQKKKEIIVDQLRNLNVATSRSRYSITTLLAALTLRNISTACYIVMSKFFTLPTVQKLRTMSAGFNVMDNAVYFTDLAKKLPFLQRICTISIDEIYMTEAMDYKNGKLHGFAEVRRLLMFFSSFFQFVFFLTLQITKDDKEKKLAKTCYCIMIETIFGKYREMVEMIPCAGVSAPQLGERLLKCIEFLQKLGFVIVCISADNNRINQSLFRILTSVSGGILNESFPNPNRLGETIFVIFDAVHIFKNIRNNWFCLKNLLKRFRFPNFTDFTAPLKTANLGDVRKLFRSCADAILVNSFKLSYKVLWLTAFEKQKLYLVDQLFHRSTIAALRGQESNETADFMDIIRCWWDLMNCRSKNAGRRRGNNWLKPFTRDTYQTDPRIDFLRRMTAWLDEWHTNPETVGQRLTDDTYKALRQSTVVTARFIPYVFEKFDPNYLLTAKLQTDPLERCFGVFRQMLGGGYRMRRFQILECAKKKRIRDHLKRLNLPDQPINIEVTEINDADLGPMTNEDELRSFLPILDVDVGDNYPISEDAMNYVSGSCANLVKRKIFADNDCETCYLVFTTGEKNGLDGSPYQAEMQRGGLLMPNERATTLTVIASKLASELYANNSFSPAFLKSANQKKILEGLMWQIVGAEYHEHECLTCGKSYDWLLKNYLSSLCNTVLRGLSKLITTQHDLQKEKERIEKQRMEKIRKEMKSAKEAAKDNETELQQLNLDDSIASLNIVDDEIIIQAPKRQRRHNQQATTPATSHHTRKTRIFNNQ